MVNNKMALNNRKCFIFALTGCIVIAILVIAVLLKPSSDVKVWKGKYLKIKAMVDKQNSVSSGEDVRLCYRINFAPIDSFVDKDYYHNSDVLFGFGRTREQIAQSVDDFNFHLYEKIWLKTKNGERVRPTLCHLERNFGMDNSKEVWVNFRVNRKMLDNEPEVFLYIDNIFPKERIARIGWKTGQLL
jgi:hypothetical protein